MKPYCIDGQKEQSLSAILPVSSLYVKCCSMHPRKYKQNLLFQNNYFQELDTWNLRKQQ